MKILLNTPLAHRYFDVAGKDIPNDFWEAFHDAAEALSFNTPEDDTVPMFIGRYFETTI